jgi:hypothetical protein
MNIKHQLASYDINWPVINGQEITHKSLKDMGFGVITNSFRLVDTPYIIDGEELMIPVPMPTYEIRRKGLQGAIRAKGGYTTVKLTKKGITIVGESVCNPTFDHFDKSVGIKLATINAVRELQKVGQI